MKLVKIIPQTDNKFLNMYDLVFLSDDGKEKHWTMASRRNPNNLVCLLKGKNIDADTVCIVPKMVDKNGEEYLILIKEFRQPINDYVYSFPAGIVENGENVIESSVRELAEEIGAEEISEINPLTDVCFNSEGMTDESVVMLEATITKLGKQNLQGTEDIKINLVKMEDLMDFIKGKKLSTRAGIYIPMIVREYELKKQLNALKDQSAQKVQPPQMM